MTAFTERPEFKLGRRGELLVSGWLQERGWSVIPSYDYAGQDHDKPPRLQGAKAAFPVPDLDVCKDGTRRWVEVKVKSSAAMYRKTRTYQHGVNNYADYIRVQEMTGTKLWLAVLEMKEVRTADEFGSAGLLLMQSFEKLGEPQHGKDCGRPMAYWPRDRFERVHTFIDIRDECLAAAVSELAKECA